MKLANGVDRATAIAMIAIFALLLLLSRGLLYWDGFAPSSGFAPVWVGAIGVLLGLLLLLGRVAPGTEGHLDLPDRSGLLRVGAVLAALWIFVALVPLLGMVVAGAVLMLFMLLAVLRRPVVPSLATVVLTTALIYGIFTLWLKVALPKGLLGI
jgi:putative tricarboxylic transport membrane protein